MGIKFRSAGYGDENMPGTEQENRDMEMGREPVTHRTAGDDRVPLSEKYALTIKEAAVYFNIGNKKMRRLAEDNLGRFAVVSGNRFLIIRPKFEQFLAQSTTI